MSTQAASDFFNKVYADPGLRKELQGVVGDVNQDVTTEDRSLGDSIAQLGKKNNFDFSATEAKDAYKLFVGKFAGNLEGQDADLSEQELASVAGGLASTRVSSGGSTCCKTC